MAQTLDLGGRKEYFPLVFNSITWPGGDGGGDGGGGGDGTNRAGRERHKTLALKHLKGL